MATVLIQCFLPLAKHRSADSSWLFFPNNLYFLEKHLQERHTGTENSPPAPEITAWLQKPCAFFVA